MIRRASLTVVALLVPTLAAAFSSGPLPDKVKLCGTTNVVRSCSDSTCHSRPRMGSSAKTFELKLGNDTPLPATYSPGRVYQLLLRFLEGAPACNSTGACTVPATQCGYGFQLASVRKGTLGMPTGCIGSPPTDDQAGCFNPDPTEQQIKCGAGSGSASCSTQCPPAGAMAVEFLEHAACRISANTPGNDGRVWTIGWTAPAAGAGTVTFYAAVNSVDAGGNRNNDVPYYANFSMDEETTSSGCEIAYVANANATSRTSPWVYTNTCGSLNPATRVMPNPPSDSDMNMQSYTNTAADLTLYQQTCGATCTNVLKFVKNINTMRIRIYIQ